MGAILISGFVSGLNVLLGDGAWLQAGRQGCDLEGFISFPRSWVCPLLSASWMP